jgi:hypothetical protein
LNDYFISHPHPDITDEQKLVVDEVIKIAEKRNEEYERNKQWPHRQIPEVKKKEEVESIVDV